MRNYYELLGISINATEQEIKEAYHKQARKYHPDNNPGQDTTDIMQELTLAYNTLRITNSRRQYDATLKHQHRTSTSYSTGYSSKKQNTNDFWSAVDEVMRKNQEAQARMKKQQQEREERMRKAQEEMIRKYIKFYSDDIVYNMNNKQKFIKPENINVTYDIENDKSKVKIKNFK